MKKLFKLLEISFFSMLIWGVPLFAQSFSAFQTHLSDVYDFLISPNEGLTSFRSLVIPKGGRDESLGQAFTGLCDDLNFMNYNPAASSILKNGQMAFNHNSWIADSKMETVTYASTAGNMGFGGQMNCFYVPFSEYNLFGQKVAGSYYSETALTLNVSYNCWAGYDFKGLAIGMNAKTAWRGMPNYTDNDTNELILGSGMEQSSLAVMADVGLMMQFNLLKFYASRDANVKIGLAVQNLGAAWTGFGNVVKVDDPLPSSANFGLSLKFIKPITVSLEVKQPFNLFDFASYEKPSASVGVEVKFTEFLAAMAGFQLKGGNPKFSLGTEFEVRKVRFNVNYTLDLTTSFSPVNRFSASALIHLGDHGRADRMAQVDKWYNDGLYWYSIRNYEMAKSCWNEALRIDRHHDPSRTGIETVNRIEEMFQKLRDAQYLE